MSTEHLTPTGLSSFANATYYFAFGKPSHPRYLTHSSGNTLTPVSAFSPFYSTIKRPHALALARSLGSD